MTGNDETTQVIERPGAEARWPRRTLLATTAAVVVVVGYAWLVRLGNDLTWDEAYNLRTYAQSPLRAAALYREPNNHPLESLLKSVCTQLLGLDQPAWYRFGGFLVLLLFLGIVRGWHRTLDARRAPLAATGAVLLCFLARAVGEQALALRGYFLSITLQLGYGLLLLRRAELVGRAGPDEVHVRPLTSRDRLAFAALSAGLLYTLPSNLVLLVPLWIATAWLIPPASSGARPGVRATTVSALRLALTSCAMAGILWLPLIASVLLGSHQIRGMPVYDIDDRAASVLGQARLLLQQLQPLGAPDLAWAAILSLLLVVAFVFRARSAVVHVALMLAVTTIVLVCLVAACFSFPARIAAPFVAPLLIATILLVLDVSARWPLRRQIGIALLLNVAALCTLPWVVGKETFRRNASNLTAFVATATHPTGQRVLVCHDGAETLRPYLHRAFGDDAVCDSQRAV